MMFVKNCSIYNSPVTNMCVLRDLLCVLGSHGSVFYVLFKVCDQKQQQCEGDFYLTFNQTEKRLSWIINQKYKYNNKVNITNM